MGDEKKAMTVRLPLDLYRAGARVARRRRISMSRLLQESLRQALKDEERRRLYEAFGQLGEPGEEAEAEVEFALPAQAQVLEGGDG
jgi:predicted transcriptional regulator